MKFILSQPCAQTHTCRILIPKFDLLAAYAASPEQCRLHFSSLAAMLGAWSGAESGWANDELGQAVRLLQLDKDARVLTLDVLRTGGRPMLVYDAE